MDTLKFGCWPQNASEPEPLEWLILEDTGEEMLLLCRYCIATKGFIFDFNDESREYRDSLWEYSDLRRWLHEEFYSAAFDEDQKKLIYGGTDLSEESFLSGRSDVRAAA